MRFLILGPLEVTRPDGPAPLGAGKQRALLALLLINRNRALAIDEVIVELWGDDAPATAPKMVQNWVSQLRKVLSNGTAESPLVTAGRGYMLRADGDEFDAAAFEQLADAGRDALAKGDYDTALARLRDGLDLWRGPALSDFVYERFAQAEIGRLEERRLAALEHRIDAELALGHHAELVAEIEALI